MDVKEIIDVFEQSPQKFQREAIREAIQQKDQIIPELLALVESPEWRPVEKMWTTIQLYEEAKTRPGKIPQYVLNFLKNGQYSTFTE